MLQIYAHKQPNGVASLCSGPRPPTAPATGKQQKSSHSQQEVHYIVGDLWFKVISYDFVEFFGAEDLRFPGVPTSRSMWIHPSRTCLGKNSMLHFPPEGPES